MLVAAAIAVAAASAPASAVAASFTWSGAAAPGMSNWSLPGNWASGTAPSGAVDALTFPDLTSAACIAVPATATCANSFNDVAAISADSLAIAGRGYGIGGAGLTLGGGGLTLTQPSPPASGSTTISNPIALGADQAWNLSGPAGGAINQTLFGLFGAVTGAGRALSITLANGTFASFNGTDNEVGPVTITGANSAAANPDSNGGVGLFNYNGTAPQLNAGNGQPVTVSHASLQGSGTIGPLTSTAAAVRIGGGLAPRTLQAASATFDAQSTTAFFIHSTGTTAGTDYSRLTSTGNVALAGGLQVVNFDQTCPTLALGTAYTLVSTTGALTGTYAGVADGDTISITPSGACPATTRLLRIDYARATSPRTVTATVVDLTPDTTGPDITITSPTEGLHVVLNSTLTASFACSDVSGVSSCTAAGPVTTATAGAKTFTVNAMDMAGNPSTKTVNYVVDADTTGPVITVNAPLEGQHYAFGAGVTPSVSCSDAGSGVATCNAPGLVDTSTAGPHTYTVTATDGAGNPSSKIVHYVVDPDTTPPVITITSPTEGQHVALNSTLTASYSCQDGPGGSGASSCTTSTAIDTSTAGQHTFTVSTADVAGNTDSKSVHYVVDPDTTAPVITILTPTEGQHFALGAAVAGRSRATAPAPP
jgi:hypothetical protein